MRVLVCGGRDFCNSVLACKILDAVGPSVIIEGGAKGADAIARAWAGMRGTAVETYYADWNTLGKSAGPIRNEKMLRDGKPDLVIAFPGGRGTADMVKKAQQASVPVVIL